MLSLSTIRIQEMCVSNNIAGIQTLKLKQPKAFYLIFFLELWERFGYYGMQALLVLYMSKVFLFSDDTAYETFAVFSALAYLTPMIGGYIGDQLLGFRRSLLLGGVLLACGYVLLALPLSRDYFYLGLCCICVGNGLFKPNTTSLLGKVYGNNDPRLESGFTLFYMAINIGSLLAMLSVGYVQEAFGWSIAFGLSAIGLIIGLISFICFMHIVKNVGSKSDLQTFNARIIPKFALGLALAIVIVYLLLHYILIANIVLSLADALVVGIFINLLLRTHGEERRKLLASLILILLSVTFFALYWQMPMSINLFTERNVDHHLFGIYIPTASFQSLNPFWIFALSPILSIAYQKLAMRNLNPSIPSKFAYGLISIGLAFIILKICTYYADQSAQVSAWWIVLSYLLGALGELLVSAIGLAMITKLAPPRLLGFMMGTWFLGSAAGAAIGGQLAKLASIPKDLIDPSKSLHIYGNVFLKYGLFTLVVGVIALLAVRAIRKLMGEDTAAKSVKLTHI
jgi:POT family proton-dependent oligopeptide transporter